MVISREKGKHARLGPLVRLLNMLNQMARPRWRAIDEKQLLFAGR
jgi:hypothetical protein